jgi:integrase/recombinase XerD
MSDRALTESAAQRYDAALRRVRHDRLPQGHPLPQPTCSWPEENVALLELYREWLLSSATSPHTVAHLYIPMAGFALGLNLKPHSQIDIQVDLERALDYVKAKRLSAEWTHMCRCALDKFRCFRRQQRGSPEVTLKPPNAERYFAALPDWLVEELHRLHRLRQANWRPSRADAHGRRFWGTHTRAWRWLFAHHSITDVSDIKRRYLLDFVDQRLADGVSTSTVNQELRAFVATLLHLQDQGYAVPISLVHIRGLKQPDRLPRFLTDEQVRKLRDEIERCVAAAVTPCARRNALIDRAAFYLLWQSGLRLGEVEDLQLEDLELTDRRLTVRQGKGRKDRTVCMTDTAAGAVQEYLAVRGMGPSDYVFLYHNHPVRKDFIRDRIKAAGDRAGVKVTPHQLRHTFATQLLNAGCKVTTIQKLLGHQRLNSTMVYARVHDRTVAQDYYAAMAQIEKLLTIDKEIDPSDALKPGKRERLLKLIDRLAEPRLPVHDRLRLLSQMRVALDPADHAAARHTASPHPCGVSSGRQDERARVP